MTRAKKLEKFQDCYGAQKFHLLSSDPIMCESCGGEYVLAVQGGSDEVVHELNQAQHSV